MISILIPARNEADRVGETLRAVLAAPELVGAEVIVIDDGSTDATAAIAQAVEGARVLTLRPGRGKGGALNAGLAAATGAVIVTLDADLGASAREAGKLLAPLLSGEAEMTIAGFPAAGRSGGFGVVMRLARWAIRRATGQEISAPLSGQRAMRRELLEAVGGFAAGYGAETGLTLDALRQGYRLQVVPTAMEHRALGRTAAGFAHRGRQLMHIAAVIWRKRAWRAYRG